MIFKACWQKLSKKGFLLMWCLLPWFVMADQDIDKQAFEQQSVADLLKQVRQQIAQNLALTGDILSHLDSRDSEFNSKQRISFVLIKASYLGLTGNHAERANLVRRALTTAIKSNVKVKYLYELSDSYVHLGEYEQALIALNQGLRLLPKLTDINAKVSILQAAVTLLSSLNALDEAYTYANRMYQMGIDNNKATYICTGLANKIEVQFKLGQTKRARSALPQALKVCNESGYSFVSTMLRTAASVNLVDSGELDEGLSQSLEILEILNTTLTNSNYVSLLEEAIARAYFQINDLEKADQYATWAFEHAIANKEKDAIKKSSKTLAQIKRSNGELAAALDYYDVYLREKDSAEQDRFAKNLAYQRVKYDSLDKTNNLELAKFRNNSLSLTQKLQQRNNENLILVVSLGTVLLVFMSILLLLSLRQKQALVLDIPTNQLVGGDMDANAMAEMAFNEARQKNSHFSVVMFELDFLAGFDTLLEENTRYTLLDLVSQVCHGQLREGDQFGRISEHQFVICLLASSEQGAVTLAQRCQQLIAKITVADDHIPTPISTTFGIAMIADNLADFHEALRAAEKALQLARELGNNSIHVYHEEENNETR